MCLESRILAGCRCSRCSPLNVPPPILSAPPDRKTAPSRSERPLQTSVSPPVGTQKAPAVRWRCAPHVADQGRLVPLHLGVLPEPKVRSWHNISARQHKHHRLSSASDLAVGASAVAEYSRSNARNAASGKNSRLWTPRSVVNRGLAIETGDRSYLGQPNPKYFLELVAGGVAALAQSTAVFRVNTPGVRWRTIWPSSFASGW